MAESYGRGFNELEINVRTILRNKYIASLESEISRISNLSMEEFALLQHNIKYNIK